MNLPQHATARLKYAAFRSSADRHRGLWWDKFFDKFDAEFSVLKDALADEKLELSLYAREYLTRQAALVAALSGKYLDFSTDWRLAVGLGSPHPTGNGFSWHPTLGVPYLSSSSIKGLLRSWLVEWCGDAARANFWLGQDNDGGPGALTIFDAVPTGAVLVGPDVMTPHYGPWYQGAREPPADWHSPIPVSFLLVKQATFRIHLTVGTMQGMPEIDFDEVFREIGLALINLGAGAKTSAGYGRMTPIPPKT